MSTNWKRQYGPTVAAGTGKTVIIAAQTFALILSKVIVSNVGAGAALGTFFINPAGAGDVQVWQRQIPIAPVTGNPMEAVELEGQILNAGDTLSFQSDTAAYLAPMVSVVQYTP